MRTLLFLLLTLVAAPVAEEPETAGEVLRFSVSYNWHAVATDVASAEISFTPETIGNQKVEHISLTARTARFFDTFFKVREGFDSWVSEDTGLPVRFIRNTREGSYTAFNRYEYDWKGRKIDAVIRKRDRDPVSKTIPLEGPCYDLPSLMSYVRHLDLTGFTEGKSVRIPYVFSDETSSISLIYRGKAVKKIKGLGQVAVLRFALTVADEDVFEAGSLAEIWLSDDENRIPVYFVAPIKVGAMSGRLKTYEGLKHPFTALQQ